MYKNKNTYLFHLFLWVQLALIMGQQDQAGLFSIRLCSFLIWNSSFYLQHFNNFKKLNQENHANYASNKHNCKGNLSYQGV